MLNEKPHLNPDLTLRLLASKLDLPDKTLSKLLNQNLNSNFSDFVNDYRINQFLLRVEMGDLENLSIAGLAMQCGFSSKSSFYRAFKKKTGTTPSDYLQNNR
jgi:AraC-like DNA-binding protein